MKTALSRSSRIRLLILVIALPSQMGASARVPFHDTLPEADFAIREEMIPMRDGVGLYTLILAPTRPAGPMPVLLLRTPYHASRGLLNRTETSLKELLGSRFMGNDYIYVFQDIRGRFQSEGDYFMYRPPRGPFNRTTTDETTDAWDSIDWLVKNLSTNGRVGIWGTSYPGWLTLAAIRGPRTRPWRQPSPSTRWWIPGKRTTGSTGVPSGEHMHSISIYSMETRTDTFIQYPYEQNEFYSWVLPQGALGTSLGTRLDERHEMWDRLMEFPAYGPYWREVAADRWFESPPRLIPALHVHGFWDQEDIYGSPAAYASLEKFDTHNDMNFFAAGPWYHGQHFEGRQQPGGAAVR